MNVCVLLPTVVCQWWSLNFTNRWSGCFGFSCGGNFLFSPVINGPAPVLYLSCGHSGWVLADAPLTSGSAMMALFIHLFTVYCLELFNFKVAFPIAYNQVSLLNWLLEAFNPLFSVSFYFSKCLTLSCACPLQWIVRCAPSVCHTSSSTSTWIAASPVERRRKAWGGKTPPNPACRVHTVTCHTAFFFIIFPKAVMFSNRPQPFRMRRKVQWGKFMTH